MIQSAEHTKTGVVKVTLADGTIMGVPYPEATPTRYGQMLGKWVDAGGVIAPYVPVVTSAQVNTERQRRIEVGIMVDLPGHGTPVSLTGDAEMVRNIQALVTAAQLRLSAGDAVTITQFRDGVNELHDLLPNEVILLWQAGVTHIEAIYAASWVLKDMSPIPEDYQDDQYWPSVSA